MAPPRCTAMATAPSSWRMTSSLCHGLLLRLRQMSADDARERWRGQLWLRLLLQAQAAARKKAEDEAAAKKATGSEEKSAVS